MGCMCRAPSRVERQSQCLSFTVLPALPKLEVSTACLHALGALFLVNSGGAHVRLQLPEHSSQQHLGLHPWLCSACQRRSIACKTAPVHVTKDRQSKASSGLVLATSPSLT